ncbi:hypothetical protein [Paenibacillus turpanensis]|uniref:hypothetical protein n=1 Tax=Paenibacillus turpanensis TaxID=2689078 RepID=UPI001408DB59|nr:hypothetical protein [Paenibacillus turpanensis]
MNMKKGISILVLSIFVLGLSACSGGDSPATIDPSNLEVTLTTKPTPPTAGAETEFLATFSGSKMPDSASLTFEIRSADTSKQFYAKRTEGSAFTGSFQFEAPGTYEVFLHLYDDVNHITKMKKVEVQ